VSNSTVDTLQTFVDSFVRVYILLIIVWIVLGYFRLPFNVWIYRVRRFLDETCEPYVRAWRRVLPSFGMLDLSPMIGIFALYAANAIVDNILDSFRPG
jgi:YggT family protein